MNEREWAEDLETVVTDAVGAVEDAIGDYHRYLSIEEQYEVYRRIIASLQKELNSYEQG